jgi:uncharacterized protein YneF (UPF0154 family)
MDIIFSFILLVLWFFFGLVIGYRLRERIAMRRVEETMEMLEEINEQSRVMVIVEQHDSEYFVYAQDGLYLTKGKTKEEISKNLKQRFPDKSFYISSESAKEVGLL